MKATEIFYYIYIYTYGGYGNLFSSALSWSFKT